MELRILMALIYRSSVNAQLKEGYDKLVNEHVGSFSCYGGYKELHDVLHKYCKKTDRILGPGCTCGREDFSLIEELYDAGYHSVVGVVSSDSSSSKRKKERKPGIEFVKGQLHDLKVSKGNLQVIECCACPGCSPCDSPFRHASVLKILRPATKVHWLDCRIPCSPFACRLITVELSILI